MNIITDAQISEHVTIDGAIVTVDFLARSGIGLGFTRPFAADIAASKIAAQPAVCGDKPAGLDIKQDQAGLYIVYAIPV